MKLWTKEGSTCVTGPISIRIYFSVRSIGLREGDRTYSLLHNPTVCH